MSTTTAPTIEQTIAPDPAGPRKRLTRKHLKGWLIAAAVLVSCSLALWLGVVIYRGAANRSQTGTPTVNVERGDISLAIFARGEVRGGNSQMLPAPMTGGGELHIRSLPTNGSSVQAGDTVVQFDTADQEYALREAQSDLAEAEQHILQAKAQMEADAEENRYALEKAQSDIGLAELEARKNPLLAAITAKQNDLAVAVARDKLAELQRDLANKKDTDEAGIVMQQAAQGKAEAKIATAKQNIESMTLRAERAGYVALKQNTNTNFFFTGMELPQFQVGDSVRPGMAVAEIPDLSHWEVGANIGELDRGHLSKGDTVDITVIALPHHAFRGRVTDIGSTSGSPWDRRFECKLSLDNPSAELRPGMSARVQITTETMRNALWLPAQALFDSDGKMFVYLRSGGTFTRKDVTLVRRNETRVVLTGLRQGDVVALANPTEAAPKKAKAGVSPLQALQ